AIRVMKGDGALEAIGVALIEGAGGFGARHAEQVAQLDQEGLKVGALGSAGTFPARDECLHQHSAPKNSVGACPCPDGRQRDDTKSVRRFVYAETGATPTATCKPSMTRRLTSS